MQQNLVIPIAVVGHAPGSIGREQDDFFAWLRREGWTSAIGRYIICREVTGLVMFRHGSRHLHGKFRHACTPQDGSGNWWQELTILLLLKNL